MINKLIKGDNIEIMKSIDENYVDLIEVGTTLIA